MKAPPPQAVVVGVMVVVVVVYLAGLPGRRAGPRAAADGRPRLGLAQVDCPKCGGDTWVSPGFEDPCPHCGVSVAGCAHCNTALIDGGNRFRTADGTGWLCPTHHADEEWRRQTLAELDAPDAKAPPPDTPRAKELRAYVVTKFRQARQDGVGEQDTFTPAKELTFWRTRQRPEGVPAAVRDAAEVYRRRDPDRGWTWMAVYRPTVGAADAFVVWCVATGGGDGWVEVFDETGTPAGCGRHQSERVVWKSRAEVRRSLFDGTLDPDLEAARRRR